MIDRRPARVARVVDALTVHHLDAFLVTGHANIRYLTGFSGSNAMLLITPRELLLMTDFRYDTQVKEEVGDLARLRIAGVSLWETLWAELPNVPRLSVIGFESAHVPHSDFGRLLSMTEGGRWQWRPHVGIVETLRESKDEGEVVLIQEAAAIATRALSVTLQQVRAGLTELQVAGILEKALRDEGSEAHPFEAIVASGPRSALPHARASRRVIGAGNLLLLDFGAEVGGYCSDITRTVVVGQATDDQRDVYAIVRAANERAASGVRAGMIGKDADALAREYITMHGFGDNFGHSLGHGIGLEVHEAPRLARTADAILPHDTVVTIEPGIYRAGWGGVRIEDDVYLGASGPRLLTDFTHDLLELSA
ncbi:MAG TPA: aminopeptidase P family protein [Gemmatimonadaceae bacterium]|nr:aminopeptidase P family protein [Gemmatimonadaceae bacterium]